VPGTRRARALVTDITTSLGGALALADALEVLADRAEGRPEQARAWSGPVGARRAVDAVTDATGLARRGSPGPAGAPWTSAFWDDPTPASSAGTPLPALWRVGRVRVPPVESGDGAAGPGAVPLAVPLLDGANLVVTAPRPHRAEAVGIILGLVTRMLAALPAGQARLTVYDPDELGGGFAGLAPLRAAKVMDPTITSRVGLEAALAELSDEVGRITGERLAGRFPSLRERALAGLPRGEPWRLLALLGRPALSDEGHRALDAVATRGPACGICVLLLAESESEGGEPAGSTLPRGEALTRRADGWVCSLSGPLTVVVDPPPPSALSERVAAAVAREASREAARPLALRDLLPATMWQEDGAAGLTVPVGVGADGPVTLTFDDDTVHGLVGGQAGAGKSTLLLDVVYGLAARYPPDQLRVHLLDFKEGLEFAQFAAPPGHDTATGAPAFFLPHADTVGMDSDREFGVAVLRGVRAQMRSRAVTMRELAARDLASLRAADPSRSWPRVLVVIDEFQVMLSPLDAVSREAVSHLEAIARQGRAYGVHLLLASQTLSGIDALDGMAGKRGSIFGQFALRVALRTSIAESRVLLSTANEEAGGLAGVGQAIINRRNGHPSGNERVRVAYADPRVLAQLRTALGAAAAAHLAGGTRAGAAIRPPRVFVGHEPAYLVTNPAFLELGNAPVPGETPDPVALVGVPLDVEHTAAAVRLQALPGRNLMVIGPSRREAVGVLEAAVVSLAVGARPGSARVDLVSASPDAAAGLAALADRVRAAGQDAVVHPAAALPALLLASAEEIRRREGTALAAGSDGVRIVVLFAADAARAGLETKDPVNRRSGLDDLRFLTRRGPSTHVHLIGWWRTPGRLLDDLGPSHRDDVGAWLAVGVPAGDLYGLAGNRPVAVSPGANRAVLFDRDGGAEPRTVIPFAPAGSPGAVDDIEPADGGGSP
jgi:DNA segregation ATPase FtsK/SpoIIIE, S-DNA-T family